MHTGTVVMGGLAYAEQEQGAIRTKNVDTWQSNCASSQAVATVAQ